VIEGTLRSIGSTQADSLAQILEADLQARAQAGERVLLGQAA
jgi:hypothetical protein